jgi:hypothetical protein
METVAQATGPGPNLADMGAAAAQLAPTNAKMPKRLRVNNRVLISVLGKPITVLDLQKSLETQFFAQFPQYRDKPEAKWEYFTVRWQDVLNDLIDRELILADAADRELDLPEGDIREEMIKRFGADLAVSTAQMGLDLDEVWEMVRLELRAQKMVGGMVMYPAFTEITPEQVKEAYDVACAESVGKEELIYRILTVRGQDAQACEFVAQRAHSLLCEECGNTGAVCKAIDGCCDLPDGITWTMSEEFRQPVKNLSPSHREVLEKLQVGTFSQPIAQRSRVDQQNVQRIFVLTGRDSKAPPPFEAAAQGIQESLAHRRANQLHEQYINQLRAKYGITQAYVSQSIPKEFKPFELN